MRLRGHFAAACWALGVLAAGPSAYAQSGVVPPSGGSSLATPVTPANGGSGVANTGNLTWTGALTFADTTGQTFTLPAVSDTIVTLAATQTLTNKSISGSQINSGTVPAAQLPLATTGAFGAVKPDGSTITVSGGVISSVSGGAGTVTSVVCGTGLTGGTITVSGTCAVGSLKSEYMWTVPSNVTVANGTTVLEINFPWSSGTITSVDYGTNGGSPSFSASVQIGGTPVTSCTALTVTSATNTNVACTGADTLASGNTVTVVISSTSGTPDQSWVKVNFTHSVT